MTIIMGLGLLFYYLWGPGRDRYEYNEPGAKEFWFVYVGPLLWDFDDLVFQGGIAIETL